MSPDVASLASDSAKASIDSLKKRYFYKLSTNLVGFMVGVVTAGLVPRGLGPRAYGNFNFLGNFFNQVMGFLDMGTSMCFYTKLSQRPKEVGLAKFYMYFGVAISCVAVAFVVLAHATSGHLRIWPGQSLYFIYLAAGWGILIWVTQVLSQMLDAYGLTVPAEIARVTQKLLGVALIVALFVLHQVTLTNFFGYQFFILLFLALVFLAIMRRRGSLPRDGERLSREEVRGYFREFYKYSHPLFVLSLVGLLTGIMDRWLLQFFGGSVQQGFFGLSYQVGAICILFTTAMTPLLMREFSVASADKDTARMAELFRRHVPLLYSLTAFLACFVALQADRVTYILGGRDYGEAALAVTIMAFYPLHQTYGQLTGSVFLATGQTALYRNVGIVFMLLGLPVTYLLIAPSGRMGLNAGATGLAIKTVLLNFISVNVLLLFTTRLLKLSFWRYFGHQIASVGCFLALAVGATFAVGCVPGIGSSVVTGFVVSGALYCVVALAVLCAVPAIAGLRRQDIERSFAFLTRRA